MNKDVVDPTPDSPRLTLLERLDVALAGRFVDRLEFEDSDPEAVAQETVSAPAPEEHAAWVSGLLALRGFRIGRDDVAAILTGSAGRFRPEHQEHKLVLGLAEIVVEVAARGIGAQPPDGWWIVDAFKRVMARIDRFRQNTLRRDQPWDGLVRVHYPEPEQLPALLDEFHVDQCFGDDPETFRELHPVRQGVRAMWRFARIAPFPDFNMTFAALAFGSHLLTHGYPPLLPAGGDRPRLERLVRGSIPLRSLPIEARLLEQVERVRSGRA